jgi:ribonuclease P protein component
VGFSVPRRVGGAVVRNRVKRLLREALRPLLPRIATRDIVVAARPPVARAKLSEVRDELADAVTRAGLIRSDTR